LLPLDFVEEARYWRLAYQDLEEASGDRGIDVPRLDEAMRLIDRWQEEAEGVAQAAEQLLADAGRMQAAKPLLSALNKKLAQAPRDFYRAQGRPGAVTERNLFAGSSYDFEGISGSTLPGIRFSLDRRDITGAEREAGIYIDALSRRIATLQAVRRRLAEVR